MNNRFSDISHLNFCTSAYNRAATTQSASLNLAKVVLVVFLPILHYILDSSRADRFFYIHVYRCTLGRYKYSPAVGDVCEMLQVNPQNSLMRWVMQLNRCYYYLTNLLTGFFSFFYAFTTS